MIAPPPPPAKISCFSCSFSLSKDKNTSEHIRNQRLEILKIPCNEHVLKFFPLNRLPMNTVHWKVFFSLCNIPGFVCSCKRIQDRISWHPSSPPPPWPRAGCACWASSGPATPSPPASTQGSWPPYSPPGARAGSWPLSGPPARTEIASQISDFGPWNYVLVYLQRMWAGQTEVSNFICHKGPIEGSLFSTVCLLFGLLIINIFPTHPPWLHLFSSLDGSCL